MLNHYKYIKFYCQPMKFKSNSKKYVTLLFYVSTIHYTKIINNY